MLDVMLSVTVDSFHQMLTSCTDRVFMESSPVVVVYISKSVCCNESNIWRSSRYFRGVPSCMQFLSLYAMSKAMV